MPAEKDWRGRGKSDALAHAQRPESFLFAPQPARWKGPLAQRAKKKEATDQGHTASGFSGKKPEGRYMRAD